MSGFRVPHRIDFRFFPDRFESFISEKMSENEKENDIFGHFSKSGRSWGPRNYQKKLDFSCFHPASLETPYLGRKLKYQRDFWNGNS